MNKQHIVINGRWYDPATGLPIAADEKITAVQPTTQSAPSRMRGVPLDTLHHHTNHKATTLSRRHVSKPKGHTQPAARLSRQHNFTVPMSQKVTKFAPHSNSTASEADVPAAKPDRPAETHPAVIRAHRRHTEHQHSRDTPSRAKVAKAKLHAQHHRIIEPERALTRTPSVALAPKPAAILKNEAITEALSRTVAPQKPHRTKKHARPKKRWLQVGTAGLAIAILGGYLTYLTMPNLSVRLAAIQSGVNAKYPGYRPNGYALNGPISFKQGEVSMTFAYAGGGQSYSLTQEKSSLDSAALREIFIKDNGDPQVTTANGLTIYRTGKSAAWINSGVLYRISGAEALSGEQIAKIAASM